MKKILLAMAVLCVIISSAFAEELSLTVNKEKGEIIIPAEVNGKYLVSPTKHALSYYKGGNGEKSIMRALVKTLIRSLQSLDGEKEIIISDGGSTNGTLEKISLFSNITPVNSPSGRARQRQFIPSSFRLVKQDGSNLGERMCNAMRDIFAAGYKRAVIIGSDIPSARAENILRAFNVLNNSDAVIGPSSDGGYWLIGIREFISEAFGISSWGNSSVLDETVRSLRGLGISWRITDTLDDLDTPEDVGQYERLHTNAKTLETVQ